MVNYILSIVGTIGLVMMIISILLFSIAYDKKSKKLLIIGLLLSAGGIVLVSIMIFSEPITGIPLFIQSFSLCLPIIGFLGSFVSIGSPITLNMFLPLQIEAAIAFWIGILVIAAFWIIPILVMIWLYSDAKTRYSSESALPLLWLLIVLMFGLIGLILYLFVRPVKIISPPPTPKNNHLEIQW